MVSKILKYYQANGFQGPILIKPVVLLLIGINEKTVILR